MLWKQINEFTPTSQWLSTAIFYFSLTQCLQHVYQLFWAVLFQVVVWGAGQLPAVASLSPVGVSAEL